MILVFVPVPPIRLWCDSVQSTPWGHPHRVRPPPFPHITLVGEDDLCAHHVDEQKSQRWSSDDHLLRRGGEHRRGERPLLQVSAAVLTWRCLRGSESDWKRLSSSISLRHTATALPKCRRLRPRMMLQPKGCGTSAHPWWVWPKNTSCTFRTWQ